MSLIIDGADQKAFDLPHFVNGWKDVRGQGMKVRLIGVKEHSEPDVISLYLMTEEFETGANHIIEALHRSLVNRARTSKIPPILFIQTDNCTRENKNTFFLSYCEALVAWGVVHTHEDIDQLFSETARALRIRQAFSLDQMADILRTSYNPRPTVEVIENMANYSGLCRDTNCVQIDNHPAFSIYRFFRFVRSTARTPASSEYFGTTCYMKVNEVDSFDIQYRGNKGFLNFAPDLRRTPPLNITSPDNYNEVTKRLESVETFVRSRRDRAALAALQEKVYKDRVAKFDWDLEIAPELNGMYLPPNTKRRILDNRVVEDLADDAGSGALLDDLDYFPGTFIAVIGSGPDPTGTFWIAEVLGTKNNKTGVVSTIDVVWYEPVASRVQRAAVNAKYIPCRTGQRNELYKATVDVDSVICSFPRLTKEQRIDVRTGKLIQTAMANYHAQSSKK